MLVRSAILAALLAAAGTAHAQVSAGTAMTYQGELMDNGQPANGTYDLQFTLYTDAVGGSQVGFSQFVENVPVTNGRFTTKVNFGPNWNGQARFVQIATRPGASTSAYTPMLPRQEMTPTPYAVGLSLPYTQAQSNVSTLFNLNQTGTGDAMNIWATSGNALAVSTTSGDAIDAATTGAGDAVYAHTTGAGHGVNATASGTGSALFGTATGTGYGVYAQASNGATSLFGYNLGPSGYAAFLRTESSANTSNTLEVQQNGSAHAIHATARVGHAGLFENTNAANTSATLRVLSNASASALWVRNTGTGRAAFIEQTNFSSSSNALEVNNNGTGLTAKFNGGDVEVNGNLYAQIGTVKNRATPVAWGTLYGTTVMKSSGNISVTSQGNGLYTVLVVGEGDPSTWTVVASMSYEDPDSPARTYAVRVGKPLSIAGQPGNGSVRLHVRCVEGCDNEFSTAAYVDFVVYKGM